MLNKEQYKTYYDIISNNIYKMKQTYKYFDDYLNLENIHFLFELVSTWEFDNKWIKNKMSEKMKLENKEEIRKEFYNSLISIPSIAEEELDDNTINGFYSTNTYKTYKISNTKTIQIRMGRQIVVDENKITQKILITFFLIYHMLIVEEIIQDEGISISIDDIKEQSDDYTITNLCKNLTSEIILKDIDEKDTIEEIKRKYDVPTWYVENYIKNKKA